LDEEDEAAEDEDPDADEDGVEFLDSLFVVIEETGLVVVLVVVVLGVVLPDDDPDMTVFDVE
jgi:hypothetical protein